MDKTEKFKKIEQELLDTYKKKNSDYGDSFSDTFKKFGIVSAATRISDKSNRLSNLIKNQKFPNYESVTDTLRDMASYCIMTLVELDND